MATESTYQYSRSNSPDPVAESAAPDRGAQTPPSRGACDALLATKWQWCELVASQHGPPAYTTRLVLLALSLHMPGDDVVVVRGVVTYTKRLAVAWPSQQVIADRSGLRLRTVKLAVAVARRAGWLSVAATVRTNNGRGWRSNEYTATVPACLAEHISHFDLKFNRPAHPNVDVVHGVPGSMDRGAYSAPPAKPPAGDVVHMTVSRGAYDGIDVVHHMPPESIQRIYKSSERARENRGAPDAPPRAPTKTPDDLKNRGSDQNSKEVRQRASAALARPVGPVGAGRQLQPITDSELAAKVAKLRGAGCDYELIVKSLSGQAGPAQLKRVLAKCR